MLGDVAVGNNSPNEDLERLKEKKTCLTDENISTNMGKEKAEKTLLGKQVVMKAKTLPLAELKNIEVFVEINELIDEAEQKIAFLNVAKQLQARSGNGRVAAKYFVSVFRSRV